VLALLFLTLPPPAPYARLVRVDTQPLGYLVIKSIDFSGFPDRICASGSEGAPPFTLLSFRLEALGIKGRWKDLSSFFRFDELGGEGICPCHGLRILQVYMSHFRDHRMTGKNLQL